VIFSSNIIKTPKSSRDGGKKRERKAPRVSSNKGEVNILRGERHFNFKNPFRCDRIFSPSIVPFQKLFPKSLGKFFLTLFGPSFILAIYMTWVVPFFFTHEPHIFSFQRVGWEGVFVESRWGTTYKKRVPECLILRNYSIIFSPIDFKEEAK
jgi:hypothetical protein